RRIRAGRTPGAERRCRESEPMHRKRPIAFRATRRADRGFIVVAVLWMLGALATLASIYAVYVVNTATGLAVNDDRLQAEGLVTAALELTAYQLSAVDERARPSRGEFMFRMGGANVAVAFRSETARIDLNEAPKPMLAGLIAALGADYEDAQFYADRIIGWRTQRNVE